MHTIPSVLSLASVAILFSTLLVVSCASSEVPPADSDFDELDEAEADYDQNSRQVVARDHFEVLDSPEMVAASEATSLEEDESVLGVSLGGEARAYPIGALGSSELVNDVCGGIPIAASW